MELSVQLSVAKGFFLHEGLCNLQMDVTGARIRVDVPRNTELV
jgi:hypothetical protein